jgi:hypothetical protein
MTFSDWLLRQRGRDRNGTGAEDPVECLAVMAWELGDRWPTTATTYEEIRDHLALTLQIHPADYIQFSLLDAWLEWELVRYGDRLAILFAARRALGYKPTRARAARRGDLPLGGVPR